MKFSIDKETKARQTTLFIWALIIFYFIFTYIVLASIFSVYSLMQRFWFFLRNYACYMKAIRLVSHIQLSCPFQFFSDWKRWGEFYAAWNIK